MEVRYGDQWQPVRGATYGHIYEETLGEEDFIESISLRYGDFVDIITFTFAVSISCNICKLNHFSQIHFTLTPEDVGLGLSRYGFRY